MYIYFQLTASEKASMVSAMKTKPEGMRSVVGKPEQLANSSLESFVTKRTANIFSQLMIDDSFLHLPPDEWIKNKAYQDGQRVVRNLQVVNDLAERGVKLCKDFNKLLTKDNDENERVLQVVEHNRKLIETNCTKTTFDKMFT